MSKLSTAAAPLLTEVAQVLARMPADAPQPLVNEIAAARRILVYGQGRTGLLMQALTMRLYHLGLDAHVAGAVTAPPVGSGDLFFVNAALGDLPTGLALMASARRAGARIALITAVPGSAAGAASDIVLHLPAQTMADDLGVGGRSVMPMGSQYELALFVLCELVVLELTRKLGVDFAAMRSRHANLL
ncbi:MAG: 6-phospho-3-hexuloisomerase [Hyphomicrobiales bacterium]